MKKVTICVPIFLIISVTTYGQTQYTLLDYFQSKDTAGWVEDGYFYHENKTDATCTKILQGWNISASVTNRSAGLSAGPLWYKKNHSFGPTIGYDTGSKFHIGGQYSWMNNGWNFVANIDAGYGKGAKPVYWYYAFATKTIGHFVGGGMIRQAYGLGPTVGWAANQNISINFVAFWDYENLDAGSKFKPAVNFKAIF